MTTRKAEQRARELLAAELRAGQMPFSADQILAGESLAHHDAAIRAIIEAERAAMREAAEIAELRELVRCLLDNDPSEPIADNGMTVLDQWRKDARTALKEAGSCK